MTRIFLRLATLTFVAAMLVTGCGKKEEAPTPILTPPVPPHAPPVVQVAKAVPEEAGGFQVIAILEGSTETEIHAKVTGYLIRQDYQEGASVKPGDLLFEIDARPFQAALDQAKASLADKRARSAAQAEIDAAQASVTAAQINLGCTKITAPVGGIAGRTGPGLGALPGLGDWIGPATPLTTISTADPIKAVFSLPRKYFLDHSDRIAKDLALPPEARAETLELLLADGKTYPQKGKWDSIDHPAPASTGLVTAYALFPNPGRVLHPGEYVKVGEGNP